MLWLQVNSLRPIEWNSLKNEKEKDSGEIVFPCKRQHGKFYDDLSCNLFESWHTSNLRSSKAKNRKLVI